MRSAVYHQIRKSSSSVHANVREANYGQSKADMLSKFEIALKECSETEGWVQLLHNANGINFEPAIVEVFTTLRLLKMKSIRVII